MTADPAAAPRRIVLAAAMRVEERPLRRQTRGVAGVTVVRTGIGRTVSVEADVVIASGLAGALTTQLAPGTVVIPDAVGDGIAEAIPCDVELVKRLRTAAVICGVMPAGGTLLTADHVVRGDERATWAARGYDAVDMESAAWARSAPRFATVRVVLDTPARELSAAWARPARAVMQPALWGEAVWLARDAPRLSTLAARIVAVALEQRI